MASNEIHLLMVLDGLLQNRSHKQQNGRGTCLDLLTTVSFSRNLTLLRSVPLRDTDHRPKASSTHVNQELQDTIRGTLSFRRGKG